LGKSDLATPQKADREDSDKSQEPGAIYSGMETLKFHIGLMFLLEG
jgi:hypothetical protein